MKLRVDLLVERVEKARKERGLSTHKLCKFIGCSVMSYWRWIEGRAEPSKIFQKRLQDFEEVVKAVKEKERKAKDEQTD